MTMSNREITALERQARAQTKLAEAITSGSGAADYKKARLALEKANGGAKVLANAAKVLEDAEKTAGKLVDEANAEVAKIVKKADGDITFKRAQLAVDVSDLTRREAVVIHEKTANDVVRTKLDERRRELKKTGDAQLARTSELDAAGRAVQAREEAVGLREAKANEFDRWREQAPAA